MPQHAVFFQDSFPEGIGDKVDNYLDDHEQAEALKQWWKKYGKAILTGVVLGLVALFGTRSWFEHRASQEQAASLVYAAFSQALTSGKSTEAERSGQQLIEQYDDTAYAALAGLGLAELKVKAGDLKGAEARLRWVLDHADQPGLVHVARLRLARVLLADKQPDAALSLLNQGKPGAFAAAYEEVSGDIYLAKGMTLQAREAYRQALENMAVDAPTRQLVQVKLNELAVADTAVDADKDNSGKDDMGKGAAAAPAANSAANASVAAPAQGETK